LEIVIAVTAQKNIIAVAADERVVAAQPTDDIGTRGPT
jgi:hypothetical protein